jgi:hypothetical protein
MATLLALPANAASLTFEARTLVSENNSNFNISVFDGAASYDDSGRDANAVPLTNTIGDGTVLSYNFVGNAGTNSPLVSYASGGTRTPTPAAPAGANTHGNGEDWANVWTVSDPVGFTTARDHNPGVVGANNTFARAAEVDGTIDISGLALGQIYIPHGTYVNNWTLTLTMSGAGQADIVSSETQGSNGIGRNFGWITEFNFTNEGQYDTVAYNWTHADRDGSRARFMGVILDGTAIPEPSAIALLGLGGLGFLLRRRR